MSEGRLEQVGTPWVVYHEPVSLFVARFIGRGNLLEGRVLAVEDERVRAALDAGGQIVVLRRSSCTVDPGQAVHFLVRPEKLRLGFEGENTLRGRVLGTEYLGDSLLLYVECPSGTWLIKLPDPDGKEFAAEGKEIAFGFSPEDGLLIGVGTRDRDSV
jgi:ABC-type Fe3+/spermidine/putrescine transport system ATPase subunit